MSAELKDYQIAAIESIQQTRKPRGFAALSPEARKALSSKGGRAAHDAGRAHVFTVEEARAAGSKGGKATQARKQAVRGEAADQGAAE